MSWTEIWHFCLKYPLQYLTNNVKNNKSIDKKLSMNTRLFKDEAK